jgi:transposase
VFHFSLARGARRQGHDADHDRLTARAIKVVIPPKSNRKVKRDIKHFRAIATRYEKTARNFLAGLHLVCALAWLK